MKSIKPGRGPSFMGGITGIFAAIVGVAWTVGAASMGAPDFFPIFGLAFTGIAICMAIYEFKNATGKNRYSDFDIVDGHEEPDPLQQRFGEQRFCIQCGKSLPEGANFCPGCGKAVKK